MFGPGPGVVSGLAANVADRRDLDLVRPFGGTLNRQPVADVNADVSAHPYRLPRQHGGPAGGAYAGTLCDHAVRSNVRASPGLEGGGGGICGPAVCLALVPGPAPKDAFNEVDAIKTESVSRGGVNHGNPSRRLVIAVILGIAFLVRRRHRCAKATHNVKGFIVLGNVNGLVDQHLAFHGHCGSSYPAAGGSSPPAGGVAAPPLLELPPPYLVSLCFISPKKPASPPAKA